MLEHPKAKYTTQKKNSEKLEKYFDSNGQSAAKPKKITDEILNKIKNNFYKTRRQLYREAGRSKKLLQWLNDNNYIMPKWWTKESFILEMKKFAEKNDRIPIASDNNWIFLRLAKRYFGTWNNSLKEVFNQVNQHRYTELSDNDLKLTVVNFIKKNQRLPLREEFNGGSYEKPYWEVFRNRFSLIKWSDIINFCVAENKLTFFVSSKSNGFGKIILFDGKVYLSTQEYLIGKYLTENNIKFEKEVEYGNSPYIFDFYLKDYDVYIEYYGIATKEYKKRIEDKRCCYDNRKIIEIFKHDNTIGKLDREVQRLNFSTVE